MTYPVWPTQLPRPERAAWSVQPQDARLKRRSDAGPVGYRRRFSSASRTVSMSIFVDRNGKAIFDNFFRDDAALGTGLFWMPDPTTDGWPLKADDGRQILTDDGTPILLSEQLLVTFGDNLPSEVVVGINFRISFSVEVMP